MAWRTLRLFHERKHDIDDAVRRLDRAITFFRQSNSLVSIFASVLAVGNELNLGAFITFSRLLPLTLSQPIVSETPSAFVSTR